MSRAAPPNVTWTARRTPGLTRRAEGAPGTPASAVEAVGLGPLGRLRIGIINWRVAPRNAAAERRLREHVVRWDLLTRAASATAVTGASYSDYWTLYNEVRRHRPTEILEVLAVEAKYVVQSCHRWVSAEG